MDISKRLVQTCLCRIRKDLDWILHVKSIDNEDHEIGDFTFHS
jgi:hypothetical protein